MMVLVTLCVQLDMYPMTVQYYYCCCCYMYVYYVIHIYICEIDYIQDNMPDRSRGMYVLETENINRTLLFQKMCIRVCVV